MFAAGTPPRNWAQCPAVATIQTSEVVYGLGDTHGDYDRLVTLLIGGKLMSSVPASPQQAVWSGGKSILIVTGDMIDKWKDSLKVIALMRALTASAASQGGQIVISAGNHEAEFLQDPQGSKTKEFQSELTAASINPSEIGCSAAAPDSPNAIRSPSMPVESLGCFAAKSTSSFVCPLRLKSRTISTNRGLRMPARRRSFRRAINPQISHPGRG